MTKRDKRVLQLRILAELAESCTFPGEEINGLAPYLTAQSIALRIMADKGDVLDLLPEMEKVGLVERAPTDCFQAWRPAWSFNGNLLFNRQDMILP